MGESPIVITTQQLEQYGRFVAEARVKRAARVAGGLDDVLHACRCKPFLDEYLSRCREQALSSQGLSLFMRFVFSLHSINKLFAKSGPLPA
ncbi:hypothetical protein LMG28690_01183 [Paraburkholderia caffeinilytica]|nr:hypothetical protein LMG28690_01183 [Paraburkholderia caffeinilytica]